jgi:uncharacterized protein YehS (DUF1456 family)
MISNNDILRRLRYAFDLNDATMVDVFLQGDKVISSEEVVCYLKKDDDAAYISMTDFDLASFLNGFISLKRGAKEGPKPAAETELNNNIVFRKLKIALALIDTDIIDILKLVDFAIGPHEISAFFRKPTQPQYRLCQDQILRNFLHGLEKKYKKVVN